MFPDDALVRADEPLRGSPLPVKAAAGRRFLPPRPVCSCWRQLLPLVASLAALPHITSPAL
jgi:hypothetical protein